MKKRVKNLLINNKFLIVLYYFFWRRKSFSILKLIHYSITSKKRITIFYCHSPGHFHSIENLPDLLVEKFLVFIICDFKSSLYNIPVKNKNIYIIYNSLAYVIPLFRADIYITAFVGQHFGFPKNASRVHFFHSISSIYGVYMIDSFDDYNYFFCAGMHQIEELTSIFKNKNIYKKCLIKGGYPRLDNQLMKLKNINYVKTDEEIFTFIYAPTYVYEFNKEISSLNKFGEKIIDSIINLGNKLIFRPHPLNINSEIVKKIVKTFSVNSNFEFDISKDYFDTYMKADAMISDISGTAFTFSFTFEKPTLFFSEIDLEGKKLKGIQYQNRENIGEVALNLKELSEKVTLIKKNYSNYKNNIVEFRNNLIFNLNESENYFVNNIDFIINNERHPDWIYI